MVVGLLAALSDMASLATVLPDDPWFEVLSKEQGRHRFRFWGFEVYEAVLRVGPTFQPMAFDRHPLALSLIYARSLSGVDMARRSMVEIERQSPLEPDLRQRWLDQLIALFPDVSAGDKLLGAYQPGQGLQMWRFDDRWQRLGESQDMELARRFFGIWLSSQTSQPAMRNALLGLKTG